MTHDEIKAAWDKAAAGPLAVDLRFDGGALVLGAGTVLAKAGAPVDEMGLAARLAAAHGHTVEALPLRHVRRAIETWREGDEALALIHLALSGLAKLARPKDDARRLFMADALLKLGVEPTAVVKTLGLGPASNPLDKYNPDQPRVAAGNGRVSGQWTSEDSVGSASDSAPRRTPNSGQPNEIAQNFDETQTCSAWIAVNCQGRILRVFPGQYLTCTVQEVRAAAAAGDRAAQTACKLLFRNEYRK
jgi:hypothetical protein